MSKRSSLASSGAVLAGVIGLIAPLALSMAVAAQTTSGIVGMITDSSGAVLPGVTVSAAGPALQVPSVVAITDSKGDYRVTPLPGRYTVTFSSRLFKPSSGKMYAWLGFRPL